MRICPRSALNHLFSARASARPGDKGRTEAWGMRIVWGPRVEKRSVYGVKKT